LLNEPTRNINFLAITQQLEQLSQRKQAVVNVYTKKCFGCQQVCAVKSRHKETAGCLLYCTNNNPKTPKWVIHFSNPTIAELTVAGVA
jgi:hypothetical protein